MRAYLPLLMAFPILLSCSSLNENQCQKADWEAYGKVDGTRGRTGAFINEHKDACSEYGVKPCYAEYERGRLEGLKFYDSQPRPSTLGTTVGAWVGALIGFGTGHAVQDRYLRAGWIFTLSEIGAVAAMIALPMACSDANCRDYTIGVPFLALLGLKAWETADVFRYAHGKAQGYPHLTDDRFARLPRPPVYAVFSTEF